MRSRWAILSRAPTRRSLLSIAIGPPASGTIATSARSPGVGAADTEHTGGGVQFVVSEGTLLGLPYLQGCSEELVAQMIAGRLTEPAETLIPERAAASRTAWPSSGSMVTDNLSTCIHTVISHTIVSVSYTHLTLPT